jgi:aspartyl/asparaginyl beta-hydroxylase (cupin superfamily)
MQAQAAKVLGDAEQEWDAINAALAADPYFLPGLLHKAEFQERLGRIKTAAATYRNALKIAPPPPRWPAELQPALLHAQAMVGEYARAFADRLHAAIAPHAAGLGSNVRRRWDEAVSIMSGQTKPYHADCNQITVPRLPAITFFDRDHFPWASALEARTEAIRAEMQAVYSQAAADFTPYIQYRPGDPVNQWRDLNHSSRWSTYWLHRGGQPVAENLARCPETAKALAEIEMATISGLCPNAMFSVLAPHTEIPPHHGETNARLVAHLPLVVPEKCRYRVGFDEISWQEGRLIVFDDTIEHTARNDSDEIRVVLIFDVWNPLLSQDERAIVNTIASAARAFHAE